MPSISAAPTPAPTGCDDGYAYIYQSDLSAYQCTVRLSILGSLESKACETHMEHGSTRVLYCASRNV